MPSKKGRKPKPPRLWLRPDDRTWIILDRGRQIRTGCGETETEAASKALAAYIGTRHKPTIGVRDPNAVAIADILMAYVEAKQPKGNDPERERRYNELCSRIDTLIDWWGDKMLSEVKRQACLDYVDWRMAQPRRRAKSAEALAKPLSTDTARRELEDLRSAISEYHAEYTLTVVPVVTLPEKGQGRDRWLRRNEAARLLGAALGFVWDVAARDFKRRDDGKLYRRDRVTRARRRHIARFILIGLYSGRREATIRRTQWLTNINGPWLDLERMIYHGRGQAERRTKKQRPPQKIANRLRPHLLRWQRLDAQLEVDLLAHGAERAECRYVVHRPDGRPLEGKIKTGWTGVLADAGLGPDVVRHALRHTAATWLMRNRTDMWEAAGWLGMTVEMLEEKYGHHHPDFQDEAASAFGGQRAIRAVQGR
jgi:integrase